MNNKKEMSAISYLNQGSICFNDHFMKPICYVRPFNNVYVALNKKPNIFYRVMMRLFFGFKFEDIK